MRRLAMLLGVLVGLVCGASPGVAQTRNPANGHYYERIVTTPMSWYAARDAAAARVHNGLRGHLVTVTSQAESDFIINTWGGPAIEEHWLGGFQDRDAPDYSEPAGGWRWVTGEAWSYTNWGGAGNPGSEPNNSRGIEHFTEFRSDGAWNDFLESGYDNADNFNTGYIVEFEEGPAVPEPGALALFLPALGVVEVLRRRRT